MDNLLEKIINNAQAEERGKLNAIKIIDGLFNELMDREKDILSRRFGLKSGSKETLEKIGKEHKLTRERVRQIEVASIKKLKKLEKLEKYVDVLKRAISQLLEEHGGMMEKEHLFDILTLFSLNAENISKEDRLKYKNHFDFLISKILPSEFEQVTTSTKFKKFFKPKDKEIGHLDELADELVDKISEGKNTLTTDQLLKMLQGLEKYDSKENKKTTDISKVYRSDLFQDEGSLINDNKILYAFLKAIANVEQNKFGHWGIHDSREIKPRTINDKIYLVLKNNDKPLHFREIAERINEIGFDKKIANPATVHNELIIDDRYVLKERGKYALKEQV